MNLQFYKPKNNFLEKYIDGYYFIDDDKSSLPISYYTFPNNFCIVSVNKNADIKIMDGAIRINPSSTNNIVSHMVHRYKYPICVEYINPIN